MKNKRYKNKKPSLTKEEAVYLICIGCGEGRCGELYKYRCGIFEREMNRLHIHEILPHEEDKPISGNAVQIPPHLEEIEIEGWKF